MTPFSTETNNQIFVKVYGLLCFVKNMNKTFGKTQIKT